MEANKTEMRDLPNRLSTKSKWLIAGGALLILVALGSLFYGLTQRTIKKEKILQEQFSRQIAIEKERTEQSNKALEEQTQGMKLMQAKMDILATSTYNADKNRDEVTIRTVYLPGTDKITERTETRIIERDNSSSGTTTEIHMASAATETLSTAASSTESLSSTAKEKATETISATSTTIIRSEVSPADQSDKHEMRFTIGAAYHDNKIKPMAGYTIKAFGIGKVIVIGPGLVVGNDLAGGALQADLFHLPRIGAGYGCDFKGKSCGPLFNIGIRLDF